MRKLLLVVLCLSLGIISANAQSKKELKKQVEQLQQQMQMQQQGYPQQQMMQQGYPQQQMQQGYYPQQQMPQQGYYPQQMQQGYPQQQQGYYPQQQMPQQQMMQQGYYPQQQMMQSPDGYSQEVQKSRIELLQFAAPDKLRAKGEGESREKQSALNMAEAQARAQMQRQIETFTKDALERYRKETAMNDAEKYQANDEQLSQTVSKGILTGCRVVDYATYYNQTTRKYKVELLVEYDKAGVMGLVESQEAQIMENRAKFEKHMQDVFDEYEMDKNGTTTAMRKQAAIDAQNEAKLDRQEQRDARRRQQDADNALRRQESNQNYNLNSQRQVQETATKMQKQKIDGEIMKGNARNQEIEY